MKILYSCLKQLVPELKAGPREVGERLAMAGFMMDGLNKVSYQGKPDYLIGLEVRQNRADCLSVIGLAREVAACYGLKFMPPTFALRYPATGNLEIKIEAVKFVKRVLATEIKGLKNSRTPQWLKTFLAFYDINSVNLLVDISNYVMLFTGYPSHLLDKNKMTGRLFWSVNKNFSGITTLDGSKIKLNQKDEIILRDEKNILGLAGIVGGRVAAVGPNTTDIIAEMAVYDRAAIRRNARDLKIATEASNRLEKDLDPNGLDYAFRFLLSLLLKNCGGTIAKPFSYYPRKRFPPIIPFDLRLSSIYAGIDISPKRSLTILKRLRFKIFKTKNGLRVVPPPDRMDINLKEDVIEEIIRLVGYEKIPANQLPELAVANKITPKRVYLAEKMRDILSTLGFDEILSWPLTKKEVNLSTNYRHWQEIITENSVNDEYPALRQSLLGGLLSQLNEYLKKNIEYIWLFEIGKIFGRENGKDKEDESLAILLRQPERSIPAIKKTGETLLRSVGFNEIRYRKAGVSPRAANPYSAWDIVIKDKPIGILYKLRSNGRLESTAFIEINLSEAIELLADFHLRSTVELSKKLVTLDANIELQKNESVDQFLEAVRKKIGENHIWGLRVYDVFPLKEKNKIRYTIRVSYQELSDKEAKEKHLKAFGL